MLELNNFSCVPDLCEWQEGEYYSFIAMARVKDYDEENPPVLPFHNKKEKFIKQWFIGSQEQFETCKPEMENLCKTLHFRLYMTADAKSLLRTVHTMSLQINRMLVDLVENPNAVSIRKLAKFSASASQMEVTSVHTKRKWHIDIDGNKMEDKKGLYDMVEKIMAVLKPFKPSELVSPNGYHIVCRRAMDIYSYLHTQLKWKEKPECVEIKENSLVLIYYFGQGKNDYGNKI